MNRLEFKELLSKNIIVLDGATGTQLQKNGMPKGVCPEKWVLENPEVLLKIQREYFQAGSNAVYTCSFGGNRVKLREFGLGDKVVEINRELALISRKAAGETGLVAGDLAPTGQFIKPVGELDFEEAVNIYKEQVRGLLEGGVDFFIVETMMDIQEARAAVLAVKESCELPICVTMTFNEDGRTLTGTAPETAIITLHSLGVDAIGCNCSTGPEKMMSFIAEMSKVATVPLIAKANAGLPKMVDGDTVFDMGAHEFGTYVKSFVDLGVCMIGGCCGTTPEYIKEVAKSTGGLKPKLAQLKHISAVTSSRKVTYIDPDKPLLSIAYRINCTENKDLMESIKGGNIDDILELALEQQDEGAQILSINVGLSGIDEKETMVEVIKLLSGIVHIPLCFESSSTSVIEAALRIYPGRALINMNLSEGGKEDVENEEILQIAEKYGAIVITP